MRPEPTTEAGRGVLHGPFVSEALKGYAPSWNMPTEVARSIVAIEAEAIRATLAAVRERVEQEVYPRFAKFNDDASDGMDVALQAVLALLDELEPRP